MDVFASPYFWAPLIGGIGLFFVIAWLVRATHRPIGRPACSNCGAPVSLDAAFCPRCGSRFGPPPG